ncbi:MAG: hypothetical protein AAFV77_06910 [Planctomycetota bacterium]
MKNHSTHRVIAVLVVAGLASISGTTMAQERDVEAADDRPLLAGPQVQEERLPGVESGFTMVRGESARMGGQPVPPQAFRAALSSLMAEDAPMTVRLSPEQRERIMAHVREFESKARGLRDRGSRGQRRAASEQDRRSGVEDRAAKRRDAGRQAPETVEEGRRGRRGQSDARPEDAMASGEQRAVMARAMADLQHRIWAELSSAQQAHVGTQIEEYRARAEEQRAGQLRERYRKEIGQRFDEAEQQRGGAARQRDRGDMRLLGRAELGPDPMLEVGHRPCHHGALFTRCHRIFGPRVGLSSPTPTSFLNRLGRLPSSVAPFGSPILDARAAVLLRCCTALAA